MLTGMHRGSLRPQWRVLHFYPTTMVDQQSINIQMQLFSSLEDNTVWSWTGEFRQVGRTWTKHLQTPFGCWDGSRDQWVAGSHWNGAVAKISVSTDFLLWSVSNSLRCCRQEQPPMCQLKAGAARGFLEWSQGYLNMYFPPFNTYYFLTRVYLALSSP